MLELLGLLALIALIFGLSIGQVVTGFGQALLWFLGFCFAVSILTKVLGSTSAKPVRKEQPKIELTEKQKKEAQKGALKNMLVCIGIAVVIFVVLILVTTLLS